MDIKNVYLHICLLAFIVYANAISNNTFPVGSQYTYAFTNDVFVHDFNGGKPIAYRLTGILNFACILQEKSKIILKFTVESQQLHVRPHGSWSQTEFFAHKSLLDTSKNHEFYAIWENGQVEKFISHQNEDIALVNWKKALVSLFQIRTTENDFIETDSSGSCDVTYRQISHMSYGRFKVRCNATDAQNFYSRSELPVKVLVQSHRSTEYTFLVDESIEKISSRDYFHISFAANTKVGGSIDSTIDLKSEGYATAIAPSKSDSINDFVASLTKYKSSSLVTKKLESIDTERVNIKKAVKERASALDSTKLGTISAANAFLQILPIARESKKEDLIKVLKANTLKEIKPQILDLLGAAQTIETHEAVKDTIDLTKNDEVDNVERYLQALAISTRPNKAVILDLVKTLKDKTYIPEKIKASLINTLGSLGYRYARLPQSNYANEIVVKIQSYFEESVKKCKQPICIEQYLHGLRNLQSPKTLELIFEFIYNEERSVSVAAAKALTQFPISTWTKDHLQKFREIFYQKSQRFDSSVRTLALDVLLAKRPNNKELTELLLHLKSKDRAFEVKKYLFEKIQMLSEEDAEFKVQVNEIIKNSSSLNNYHIFAQNGLTTALSRQFSKNSPFNGTLISIQEIFGGVLKRGVVDMTINTENEKYSMFTLGLYAGGLSSFVSSSSNSDNDNEIDEGDGYSEDPPNSGMEITIQGSYFRPLEFFRGQGELMGHVWSGTASEPTPAYTATSILHDHQESLQLQNGATVNIRMNSAISIDLNGQIQVSLWNRNAQCKVNKNTGFVISGIIEVNAGFVTLDSVFTLEKEPKLNLITDINFSDENLLCMQLSQSEDTLRHTIEKHQRIDSVGHKVKTINKFKYPIIGFTHYLNKKNNDMCNLIL